MNLPFSISIDKNEKRDALRLALQSAFAAVAAFIILKSLSLPETFLCVLSAVLVVEPSIGSTISQSISRVLATLLGSAIGFGISAVIPTGFGVALSLAVSMLVLNFIAGIKPSWRYGVVAAVAIALGSEIGLFDATLDRLIAIGIGVSVGIVSSLIIWPEKSENRANRYIRYALETANKRFDIAIGNTRDKENKTADDIANTFHKKIDYAQKMSSVTKFADKTSIQEKIKHTKNLYNSILIIHRVGQESYSGISDGSSNIEKDSENMKESVSELLDLLAKQKTIEQDLVDRFSKNMSSIIDNVKIDDGDKTVNMLRQTFVFGLTEIKESIEGLVESYKE